MRLPTVIFFSRGWNQTNPVFVQAAKTRDWIKHRKYWHITWLLYLEKSLQRQPLKMAMMPKKRMLTQVVMTTTIKVSPENGTSFSQSSNVHNFSTHDCLNGLLFKNKAFLSKMLLILKKWKELGYNSHVANYFVSFDVDFLFTDKDEPDFFSATDEVFKFRAIFF